MSKDINKVDIDSASGSDYLLVSVGGKLRRVLVSDFMDWYKLKNKPFYETMVEVVVEALPETTLSNAYPDDNYPVFVTKELAIEAGKTYIVKIDGAEYECVAKNLTLPGDSNETVVLGNLKRYSSVGGTDTGEPFSMRMSNSALLIEMYDKRLELTIAIDRKDFVEEVTPLDKKYLDTDYINEMIDEKMENAPQGSGGVTSWNDLQDKPFYSEGGFVEILPSTMLEPADPDPDMPMYVMQMTTAIENGVTYTVNWNGVEYQCTSVEMNDDGDQFIMLGNLGMSGEAPDTGEPFFFGYVPSEGTAMCYALDGSQTLTISIGVGGVIYHKLPAEYIDLQWSPNPTGEKVLGAEKTITSVTSYPDDTSGGFPGITSDGMYHGKYLIVYLDGERYECRVTYNDDYDMYYVMDSKLPFRIQFHSGHISLVVLEDEANGDTDKPHTASINVYVYDKLGEECIPDTVLKTTVQELNKDQILQISKNTGFVRGYIKEVKILANSWTDNGDGTYTQTVSVDGVNVNDAIYCYVTPKSTIWLSSWNTGSLTFTATDINYNNFMLMKVTGFRYGTII